MKVCILTSVHPCFDVRIFHKEARTLVNAGYDVTLIVQHTKNVIVDGVKIIALPKPKNRFFRIFGTTCQVFMLALKQRADIYHFHDPELLPIGILLKILRETKVIYDVHEDVSKQILSKYWIPKLLRGLISVLFNLFENLLSKKFDYIITATVNIRNKFKIGKAIDIKNYPIVDSNFQIIHSYNKNKYTIIYVGGLERIRGIKEIVRALEFVNPKYNVTLKLLGEFSEKSFVKEVKNLKGWDKTYFLGYVSYREIYKYLEKVNIGLVCFLPAPNHIFSMPNKLFEYMAAGLPIVTSNFPLWKKIVEVNKCGLTVNPLNPKEIAKAVEWLIEHPDEAEKMGANGRKAVLEKYNWEKESKKLLKLYEDIQKK
ncbi:glycosyltransferase family 4 protein [candidate division WOR-3 bacterium]|nr:glycosyltransferase family 4 protein [candidate division WOR-3 bacterium]